MVGKAFASGLFAIALAAAPAFAQQAEDPGRARETCFEVSLDGDFKLKIPCPPGTRPLLEKLPLPAEPAPRRDIVIDPEWPHDQAMAVEHDWPHDWGMIAPQADAEEDTIPLFGDLLDLVNPYLSGNRVEEGDQDGWYFGLDESHPSDSSEEEGGWGVPQFGEELK